MNQWICPRCNEKVWEDHDKCWNCSSDREGNLCLQPNIEAGYAIKNDFQEVILNDDTLSREEKFNNILIRYIQEGYIVDFRTNDSVQFIKKKQFSLIWALFWFCFFGIGIIFYLSYYASKSDLIIHVPIPANKENTGTNKSIENLHKLAELLEKKLITKEEFDMQKNKLLNK